MCLYNCGGVFSTEIMSPTVDMIIDSLIISIVVYKSRSPGEGETATHCHVAEQMLCAFPKVTGYSERMQVLYQLKDKLWKGNCQVNKQGIQVQAGRFKVKR